MSSGQAPSSPAWKDRVLARAGLAKGLHWSVWEGAECSSRTFHWSPFHSTCWWRARCSLGPVLGSAGGRDDVGPTAWGWRGSPWDFLRSSFHPSSPCSEVRLPHPAWPQSLGFLDFFTAANSLCTLCSFVTLPSVLLPFFLFASHRLPLSSLHKTPKGPLE